MINKVHNKLSLLIAILDQGFISAATFVTGILIARILGAEVFGVYVLANGLFLLLAALQQAFVLSPMSVYGARDSLEVGAYLYSTRKLQVLIAAVITLIIFVIGNLSVIQSISQEAKIAYICLAPVTFFQLSYEFWRQLLLTRQKLNLLLTIDVVSKTILVASLTTLALFYSESVNLIDVYFILIVSAIIGNLIAWLRVKNIFIKKNPIKYWKKNIEYGRWAVSNLIILMVNGQVPPYMTALIFGSSATGALGASVQLLGVFQIFLNGITNYYMPVAVKTYKGCDIKSLKKLILQIMILMTGIVTLVTLPSIIYAGTVVEAIYGDEFLSEGVLIFRIMLFVSFILVLQRSLDIMVRVQEKMKLRSYVSIAEFLFLVTTLYYSATQYGLAGIAIVTVLGRLLSTILLFLIIWPGEKH